MKRNTVNLPVEFNLTAYGECLNWGLKDWSAALLVRQESFYNPEFQPEQWTTQGRDFSDIKSLILELIQEPNAKFLPQFEPDWSIVSDLSIEDFFFGAALLGQAASYGMVYKKIVENREVIGNSNHTNRYDDPETLERIKFNLTPAWKFHKQLMPSLGNDANPIEQLAQFSISVDLRATDKTLMNQFEFWLKKVRRNANIENIETNFGKDKFEKWHNLRLLPYLDLQAWARLNNTRITSRQYLDLLFRDGKPMEETQFKRTVVKNALQLMDAKYLFALQSEAYFMHVVPNCEEKNDKNSIS